MNLLEILAKSKAVLEDIKNGERVAAARKVLELIGAALDLAEGAGFHAGPDDEATKKEIAATIKEAKKEAAKSTKTAKGAKGAAEPKGKIGDGQILKLLLDLALKFLPLLL